MQRRVPHPAVLAVILAAAPFKIWGGTVSNTGLDQALTPPVPTPHYQLFVDDHPAKKDVFSFTLHGSLSEELARHMHGSDRFSDLISHIGLDASGQLSPGLKYRVSGRFDYNAVFDRVHYADPAQSDERVQYELRDTYIDYSNGPWDVRLGKQQIVWGDVVGAFVADIVNAKDYRRNVLEDFDQLRTPEWGADVEYSHDKFHAEGFVIPAPEFDKFGVDGAEFERALPVPPGVTFTRPDPKQPYGFTNAKAGAKVSYLVGGFDLSAFFVHGWTHSPVEYRTINGGSFDFDPKYKRLNSVGGSFSKEINDTVISGEFVFDKSNYFSSLDLDSPDGVAKSDDLVYVIGMDRTFFEKLDIGVQFFQKVIFDYQESFAGERRVSNSASFHLKRDFLNHKIEAEFLMLASLNSPDFIYQPNIKYNISSHWQIKCGMDMFAGHALNPFGYYRSKSRYYIIFVYKF